MFSLYLRGNLENYRLVRVPFILHDNICIIDRYVDIEDTSQSSIVYIHNDQIYMRFNFGELYICYQY